MSLRTWRHCLPLLILLALLAPRIADAGGNSTTVYSNCQQVELFLEGQSLGTKPKPANDSPRTWTAAAGSLKAVGSNDGKTVATCEHHAIGPAAKIGLAADPVSANLTHDYDDVAALQVTVTDAAGNPVAGATPEVQFPIDGPGADNHESFQGHQVRAAGGRCTVYVRATADSGAVTVTAAANSLGADTVTLHAQRVKGE